MRPSAVAAIALVSAFLGGTGALLLGKATGWVDGGRETVVLRDAAPVTPASHVETGPSDDTATPLPGNDFDSEEIYRERADGVVTVYALFDERDELDAGTAQGSGFVASADGYVLTNSHVITTAGEGDPSRVPEPARTVFVEFRGGERVEAEIVGWDVFDDVGLLKVDPAAHRLRPIPLGDSGDVEVGEPVAAIGSPFGQAGSLSVGVVSATERSVDSLTSGYSLVDAIQTDTQINRGNSGGPLLDARGRAIGVNAQIRSVSGLAEGVGFAVPISSARRSMEQLIETGRVRYAWVGISTHTLTPGLARELDLSTSRGASVQAVVDGSPADAAGIREGDEEARVAGLDLCAGGDVIVAIDGRPVATAEDVVRVVTERFPGDTARFTIFRGSERIEVDVRLGERTQNPPELDRDCG